MLNQIEEWIDHTNTVYSNQRICCEKFVAEFAGFYEPAFLKEAGFVVIDKIPKPDFPELRQMGLGGFIDMHVDGITYKDTYYILPHAVDNTKLHFHELVHVAQWKCLGASNFIQRYIDEIQTKGYWDAPIEQMAYALGDHFSNGGGKIDVPNYVLERYRI